MTTLTCITCNRSGEGDPREWHVAQHPFRSADDARAGVGWKGPSEPRRDDNTTIRPPRYPFDPVLRQALIDKGVLTPDDLRDAEAKILVVSGQFQDAVREAMKDDGAATTGSGV